MDSVRFASPIRSHAASLHISQADHVSERSAQQSLPTPLHAYAARVSSVSFSRRFTIQLH
jgi:hypothetical protein